MLRYSFFYLLFLATLCWYGCSTSPDLERDNVNDPKSESYVPQLPANSPLSYTIDNERNVILSWQQKEFQDGVIISKKYRSNSSFNTLDTLLGNQLSFTDNSGHFTEGTTYKVDFFRLLDDSSLVMNKEPSQIAFNFEPFEEIEIYYNNRLEVTADYGRSNQGFIRYFDGLEVLINPSGNLESSNWDTVATIGFDSYSNGLFDSDITFDLYDLNIKVNQFIADSAGNRITISSKARQFYINGIYDVEFKFNDELSGILSWKNNSGFRSGFIIESTRIDTIYLSFNSVTYPLNFTKAPEIPFRPSIQPFVNNNFGQKVSTTRSASPDVVVPELDEFTSIDQNTFRLKWRVHREDQAAGYIIEQSVRPENNYVPIDTVSPDQRSYTLSNLDKDQTYNFAVHTYTSEWSRSIAVGFQKTFSPSISDELEVYGSNIIYSKDSKFMAKLVPEDYSDGYEYILVKNLKSNQEYTLELPREFDDWGAVFNGFVVSETNNTLIFLWDRDRVDEAYDYISVYNFIDNEYIIENKPRPGYGGNRIQLLSNDEYVVLTSSEGFTIFDTQEDQLIRQIPSSGNWNAILRPNKDTAINCSDSGIFEYNLMTGEIINQSNEACYRANINESSGVMVFSSINSFKVLDLDSFSIINNINDERIDLSDLPFNFWYFPEDNLLIYLSGFGLYNGYNADLESAFTFTIPSYVGNRVGNIERINRNSDGTYSITTFDGQFIYEYDESWSLIE